MKISDAGFLKTLSNLTSTHQRNFLLLLLVPILLVVAMGEIETNVMSFASQRDAPKKVDAARKQIDAHTQIYDQVKSAILGFEPKDILDGVSPELLAKYFVTFVHVPPPPPKPVVIAAAGSAAAKPKPKPPVIKPSEQVISLIFYKGDGEDNFIILNEDILKQGQTNAKGVTVKAIEKDRVLLTNKWSSEWVTLNF